MAAFPHKPRLLLAALAIAVCSGCASTPNAYIPTKSDWKESTKKSLQDPATWVPIVGAAAVVATNSDGHLSNWASSKHPVFGSHKGSGDFSNDGKDALTVLALGSVLVTPQSHPDEPWVAEKAEDLVMAYVTHG